MITSYPAGDYQVGEETKSMSDSNDKSRQPGATIGAGIAIGAGLGVALGTALGNLALGIAIGVAIGVALGTAMEQQRKGQVVESGSRPLILVAMAIGLVLFGVVVFLLLRLR
jgi:F0F1-type ATP synthase membrane subunit c/vacuolar-type H+-ATPase subunit K